MQVTPEPVTLEQQDMSPIKSMASMEEPHSPAALETSFQPAMDQTLTLRCALSAVSAMPFR